MSSTDVAVPEPQNPPGIPPALAGPNAHTPVIPTPMLYRLLRAESRLAWLPASATAVSGGVDLWLHEAMLHAIHTNIWSAPLAVAIGAASNGLTSLIATWLLARHDALDGLAVKKIGWGSVAAGAVLTLFGVQPVIDAGYVAAAAVATGPWHKRRWQARRALRQQLLATSTNTTNTPQREYPQLAAAAPVAAVTAGPAALATMDEVVDIINRWALAVATSHVPGSHLTDGQLHAEGRMSFLLHSSDQGTTLEVINKKREAIAAALKLRRSQDLVFDEPDSDHLDRSVFRVQVINRASSTARSAYVIARMETHPDNPFSIRIGRYIDTGQPYYYDLADHTGLHSGAIVAGTGMGKSSLTDQIAYRARQLGFHVLYIDPTDGTSSPVLSRYATWLALGADKAPAALRFMEQTTLDRRQWFKMHLHAGIAEILPGMVAPCAPNGTHPDPRCPCGGVVPPPILTIVEECDLIFDEKLPRSSERYGIPWGRQAKQIRKLGKSMLAVTQVQEVKAFGSVDLLRSSLTTRNFIAGHISTNAGGQLIPGLPYSPKLIPKQYGRALACGQTTRRMEIMLDWMPRRARAAEAPGCAAFAEDLFDALPAERLWPLDVAAAQQWLPHDDTGTVDPADTAVRERFAAVMAGRRPPVQPATVTTPAATLPAPAPIGMSWAAPITVEDLEAMLALEQPASVPADTTAVLAAIAESDLLVGAEDYVPSETVLTVVADALGWPVNTEGGRRLSAALRAVGVESDRPSIAGRKVTAYKRWDLGQAVRRHHNTNAA